jgi:hypothetical protein
MRYWVLIFLLGAFYCGWGQAKISRTDFKFNSIGEASVILELVVSLPHDEIINDETFHELNQNLSPSLQSVGNTVNGDGLTVSIDPAVNNTIRITLEKFTQEQLKALYKHGTDCFIAIAAPVQFTSDKNNRYSFSPQEIKTATHQSIKLNSATLSELIEAKGGPIYSIQNNIDFGVVPKTSETEQTEYYIRFGYRTSYPLNNVPLFFFAEGLLTTNSQDSLNYITIYPINYKLAGKLSEVVIQTGVEGNQRFSNFRSSASIYWQGLIPNLVNFTMGEDRLRLKPVLKIGARFYQEFENNRPAEVSGNESANQLYADFYYYIPIKKIYSATLQANTFYDTNKKVNPNKEVKYNYALTLGVDIPNTGIKTIFKYAAGENNITYKKDEIFLIGFMADLFSK